MTTLDRRACLTSGQAFRYHLSPEKTVHAANRYMGVWNLEDELIETDAPRGFWEHYFDEEEDYEALMALWPSHPILDEARRLAKGVRILRQESFEVIISFILSANSNIPRIQKNVEGLCRLFGEKRPWGHAFPKPEELMMAREETLRQELRLGYRAPYVRKSAEILAEKGALASLEGLDTKTLERELLTLPGVGVKVARCILLFGFHRLEAFPVDTWMRKVLEEIHHRPISPNAAQDWAIETFGPTAGLAQQVLFVMSREKGRKARP